MGGITIFCGRDRVKRSIKRTFSQSDLSDWFVSQQEEQAPAPALTKVHLRARPEVCSEESVLFSVDGSMRRRFVIKFRITSGQAHLLRYKNKK